MNNNEDRDDMKQDAPQEPQKDNQGRGDDDQYWRSPFGGPKNGQQPKQPNPGPQRGPNRKGFGKNSLALAVFAVIIVMFVFMLFSNNSMGTTETSTYSEFLNQVELGQVRTAEIIEQTSIKYTVRNSNVPIVTRIPYFDANLIKVLTDNNVDVKGVEQTPSIFSYILPILSYGVTIVLLVMLWRMMSGSNSKMMTSFGKSHAKEYVDTNVKTTFRDVAGQKEAKYELEEVVEFLKNPARFQEIGAKIPKGVLLVGPPGTGKTLLAKAVAGEAGVAFFHTSGSDFVEMFVGMGAARVRDLFEQGRKHAPCILFIDELDAVGRTRGSGLGGGHDEREQTLNQMLVEMDGFDTATGVIVVAATNRPDVLDAALLRPGRFDRQVVVDLPDIQEREAILRIHAEKIKTSGDVDLHKIAQATPGTSGADLANLINEAALFAAREKKQKVSMSDVEKARDKIILGVARQSRFMTEDEKRATAYHEAGHALLHYYLKHVDPLHKVTIIPHGRALGLTISLPEKDVYTKNKSGLMDLIKMFMGGYVAEELVYGETTTGTSNDIKQATEMARRMVTEWGMSSLGFVSYGKEDEPLFLGREIVQHKDYSDETARKIDAEVHRILDEALSATRSILSEHRDQLDKLTDALLEKETLDDGEVRELLGFEPLEKLTTLI